MNSKAFFTHPLGIILAATGATFLWGSAFPFIKLSYERLAIAPTDLGEQMLFAGYRFFLASIFIFIILKLMNRNVRLHRKDLAPLAKIGLVQTFLQYVFFYIGLSYSTGIQGSIIGGTTSFFQIIFAHFIYVDDKINKLKATGLLVGFSGVVLVNLPGSEMQFNFGIGEILLLCAMAAGGLGNILARNGSQRIDVIYLTAYQMLIGSLGLIIIGIISVGFSPFQFDLISGAMFIYLAFLSAAGFLLWNNVMKYNQVGKVSLYLFFIPIFGVMLSALLLGEQLHSIVLLALALVVSGIVIVNRQNE